MARSKGLSLYKSILRAHSKYLPMEMRQLGDAYVKSEFRLHKSVTKTEQLQQFFTEWEKYLTHIEQTGRKKQSAEAGLMDSPSLQSGSSLLQENGQKHRSGFGKDVTREVTFNEEQESQLRKLREEAIKGGALNLKE
eukprot:CCRYP_016604-RA/>CCRYP_016604-RA protein AED:0.09 eAED:0.09 QI:206/1/1/1/1/1/2/145/136